MKKLTKTPDRSRRWWRLRLELALRMALACCMVAGATMFGPGRRVMTYPAFSYVTTILIVSDATLGEAMRGFWHAGYATLQVIPPAILSLYVIGPARFTAALAAAAVAAGAFLVALPEWTHLMTKRIAFGQLVIVYVGAVVHGHGGTDTGFLMHPLHVAASTGAGALASVLAMLVPFPRLAHWEMKKACKLYAENASERLNLYVEAITCQNKSLALDSISQAKALSETAAKTLQTIDDNKEAMLMERPDIRFSRTNHKNPSKNLRHIEMPIRGMQIALASHPSLPLQMPHADLLHFINISKSQINLKLTQPNLSTTQTKPILPCHVTTPSYQNLPILFFLLTINLLQEDPHTGTHQNPESTNRRKLVQIKLDNEPAQGPLNLLSRAWPDRQTTVFAVKCAISLGLAVLFGIAYDAKNGYWSGLTIAISFVTGRQATFTVANARAQGTAMGSVYGIISLFILHSHVSIQLRFIPLVTWIVFSSFLRHSKMYGQAGAISAVIGALLILGRTEYGPPAQFAIARITEATIGLTCLVLVEVLLQPNRAATLAKREFARTLTALRECVDQFDESESESDTTAKDKKLRSHVKKLAELVDEADQEPNFWFLPFNSACYHALLASLSTVTDVLFFSTRIRCHISQLSHITSSDDLCDNFKILKEKICVTLECLEEVTKIESMKALDKKWREKSKTHDIESGKLPNSRAFIEEEEIEKLVTHFLQHWEEIANDSKFGEEVKSKSVLYWSGVGFCIDRLMRETIEIEKQVKELLTWENPKNHIDLREITNKVKFVYS